jgi:hypothetical protein
MRKIPLVLVLILGMAGLARAQQKQVLSAAAATCTTTGTVCLINSVDPGVGGMTFTVSANASSNTLQFEASGDGATTWVALNATPSNSTTAASSTTSTGTWQANVAGYTNVRIRMSTLAGGTSTVSIISSFASARAGGGGGGGGGTVTNVTGSAPIASSGGTTPAISCATCVTSAAALTSNALVVGGGGQAASTGNGDFTYATNTLTMGASGLLDLHSGGANSFKPPSQANPTAAGACAWVVNTALTCMNGTPSQIWFPYASSPGGASTDCSANNQVMISVANNAGPGCEALSAFVSGSDYTNATAGATNVTGLSFPIKASQKYAISCKLIYQGSATTTTMTLTSTGPATPTKVTAQTVMDTTSGSGAAFFSGATDGTTFGFTLGPPTAIVTTATDLYSTLDVGIINGVNAGTWQLQATNGTGTLTIRAGSFCKIQ